MKGQQNPCPPPHPRLQQVHHLLHPPLPHPHPHRPQVSAIEPDFLFFFFFFFYFISLKIFWSTCKLCVFLHSVDYFSLDLFTFSRREIQRRRFLYLTFLVAEYNYLCSGIKKKKNKSGHIFWNPTIIINHYSFHFGKK